jgi:hypothetical protein
MASEHKLSMEIKHNALLISELDGDHLPPAFSSSVTYREVEPTGQRSSIAEKNFLLAERNSLWPRR